MILLLAGNYDEAVIFARERGWPYMAWKCIPFGGSGWAGEGLKYPVLVRCGTWFARLDIEEVENLLKRVQAVELSALPKNEPEEEPKKQEKVRTVRFID